MGAFMVSGLAVAVCGFCGDGAGCVGYTWRYGDGNYVFGNGDESGDTADRVRLCGLWQRRPARPADADERVGEHRRA